MLAIKSQIQAISNLASRHINPVWQVHVKAGLLENLCLISQGIQ